MSFVAHGGISIYDSHIAALDLVLDPQNFASAYEASSVWSPPYSDLDIVCGLRGHDREHQEHMFSPTGSLSPHFK
jgi:hypothetical protein